MFDDFEGEVWDEHQWEAHLNEIEKQNTKLQKFIAPDSSDRAPRWLHLIRESNNTFDAVDAFIEEELRFDDPYFTDNNDEDLPSEWEDELDETLWEDWEEELFWDDDEDDFDEGEEWKELSEDFASSNNGSIEMLDIYNHSRELSASILQWTESLNPQKLGAPCNDFIGNVLKIGAKIAGGYSFGFEHEFLGANIAYTKKGLHCANDALTLLQRELKKTGLLTNKSYYHFHEQLFDLRNNIGIYIQEMREEFNDGV